MDIINNIKSVFQTTDKIRWADIEKIKIDSELEGIFVQKETEIQNIADNMRKNGFDPAHPIILAYCKEHPELNDINADGHTRYKAAIRAGLTKVAVIYKAFANREELLKFVYKQQLLRRNLSENEIFNAWSALNQLTDAEGKKAKSDSEIAEDLKISRRQVSKMKEVERKATPETLQSIRSGELTINKAYTQIKNEESKSEDEKTYVPTEEKKENATKLELKIEDTKPEVKPKSAKPKVDKYLNGFITGMTYVLDSLKSGKLKENLSAELNELKAGTTSVEAIQKSLVSFKESYESE